MKKSKLTPILCALALLLSLGLPACQPKKTSAGETADGPAWSSLKAEGTLPLQYATQFSVTNYTDGYRLIDITNSGKYFVIPEGRGVPTGLESGVVVLKQPLDHIYLAATSAMDLFRALDGVGNIRLSGEQADGWYIDAAKQAMQNGGMVYAGKYNTPDYELIYAEKCDLAVESTMINHTPEVKEQLEHLGVPVLVERSSYESDPLGRMLIGDAVTHTNYRRSDLYNPSFTTEFRQAKQVEP